MKIEATGPENLCITTPKGEWTSRRVANVLGAGVVQYGIVYLLSEMTNFHLNSLSVVDLPIAVTAATSVGVVSGLIAGMVRDPKERIEKMESEADGEGLAKAVMAGVAVTQLATPGIVNGAVGALTILAHDVTARFVAKRRMR